MCVHVMSRWVGARGDVVKLTTWPCLVQDATKASASAPKGSRDKQLAVSGLAPPP